MPRITSWCKLPHERAIHQPNCIIFGEKRPMLTGAQIRAGRALVRWSARELAEHANVGLNTVQRLEAVDGIPAATAKTLSTIRSALEAAGVEFIEGGAKLRG
ncbi:MAG TPA: transcriptional regulator [Patescibacteria group bacterium]|nr:transcriptional regulator [Patescibacteria group bacterium]